MHLILIKNLFIDLMSHLGEKNIPRLMEFLDYILSEYRRVPIKVYAFLTHPNETRKAFDDFLIMKQGEPKISKTLNKRINTPAETSQYKLIEKINIKSSNKKFQVEKEIERVTTIGHKIQIKTCLVCNSRPIDTFHLGPGICNACRMFFIYSYKKCHLLKCERNNKCQKLIGHGQCKLCRYQRCIEAGMKWRGRVRQRVKMPKEFKKSLPQSMGQLCLTSDVKCICCGSTNKVSNHYGTQMCNKCVSWYCNIRNSESKRQRLVCRQKFSQLKNECHKLSDFEPKSCGKCRFDKIQVFVKF
ncbi:unnamed protein product [Brachionus calyciflorus]|uniref:Nuclear receptor domain-containing protein n=1 Tax=Brachionus calyciflorus TaxID=104777 RepID=A0A814NAG0_9BILA|nr:unnamed protein product [Brachionus calyciflorus]